MKNTDEIRMELQAASVNELPEFIHAYGSDDRAGVRKLVETARKRMASLEKEKQRIEQLRVYEKQYEGCGLICGIDVV